MSQMNTVELISQIYEWLSLKKSMNGLMKYNMNECMKECTNRNEQIKFVGI